jgi:Kef-type K+ transport system membrane component KefB
MDEKDHGMDPLLKKYFRMIIRSLSYGLLWMIFFISVGLNFDLLVPRGKASWQNWTFYGLSFLSFLALLRFYIRIWKPPLR